MRIVDESDDIVPWISHSRDHDVFSDIRGLLDFPGSTFEKIIIRFFYIVYSPKCHDIFSFHCFFSLQSEFISTDIVADIVGLIEMWKCLECLAVPCFRFSEIIHFIQSSTESEDFRIHEMSIIKIRESFGETVSLLPWQQ